VDILGVFYVCARLGEKEAIKEISRFFIASLIPGVLLCDFVDMQLV